MKFITAIQAHLQKTAIIEGQKKWTYQDLLDGCTSFALCLHKTTHHLKGARVAFMVDPGFDYVKVQWSIWRSGGIAVPLCLTHPLPSLQYVLEDTAASIIVVSPPYKQLLNEYAVERDIRLITTEESSSASVISLPMIDATDPALILYTSGTTNKPKGVVLTHANLEAQMENLIDAWKWSAEDHTLCVLPLHHVHGIVNVVGCSMMSGATCEFIPNFSAENIFELFLNDHINVFMAVPTIYYKLIAYWETLPETKQEMIHAALKKFRLLVCGSAALPVSTMEKWERISGHLLLERYGMTEIGMAISNPYHGDRRAGYVGIPLPNVEVRLVDDQFQDLPIGEQGEILVKGKSVFKEYWGKPTETKKEFTPDGWFKTGDVAIIENGYYRIVGRSSVDIIKSGGYKISALEIEEVLRNHEWINDCAVVGIPDDEWGELVVAAVETRDGFDVSIINQWIREQMPSYKTPKKYIFLESLPRNAMGKVVKNEIKKLFT